jgi:hypothetical protein
VAVTLRCFGLCCAEHMEMVSVGTEGQGPLCAQSGGLMIRLSEIVVDMFHLNILAIEGTIKQTKTDSV